MANPLVHAGPQAVVRDTFNVATGRTTTFDDDVADYDDDINLIPIDATQRTAITSHNNASSTSPRRLFSFADNNGQQQPQPVNGGGGGRTTRSAAAEVDGTIGSPSSPTRGGRNNRLRTVVVDAVASKMAAGGGDQLSSRSMVLSDSIRLFTSPSLASLKVPEIDREEELQKYTAKFAEVFPQSISSLYAEKMVEAAILFDNPVPLDANELYRIGIKVGHRRFVEAILESLRSIAAGGDVDEGGGETADDDEDDQTEMLSSVAAMSTSHEGTTTDGIGAGVDAHHHSLTYGVVWSSAGAGSPADRKHGSIVKRTQTSSVPSRAAGLRHSPSLIDSPPPDLAIAMKAASTGSLLPPPLPTMLLGEQRLTTSGIVWEHWRGSHRSLEEFLHDIRQLFVFHDIPMAFMRCFANNKPVPFYLDAPATAGRIVNGLLLRVLRADLINPEKPGRLNTKSTTLDRMTNRFVILYQPPSRKTNGVILTYVKDYDSTWYNDIARRWHTIRASSSSASHLLLKIFREAMEAMRPPLQLLRNELDALALMPDAYKPKIVVEALSRVQRQAAVIRRSIVSNVKAMVTFQHQNGGVVVENDVVGILDLLDDLREIADEIENNAVEMLSLRLALVGFRSQLNMTVFTYMNVVLQPATLVTGWFGMNFEGMDELHIWWAYYAVMAAVGIIVAIIIAAMMYTSSRDASIDDERKAAVQLFNEEED